MNKWYSYICLFIFSIISMITTNNIIISYRGADPIMKKIEESSSKYLVSSIDAIIHNQDIIPGSYGKEVNINDSYYEMKNYGSYNELLTVFQEVKPSVSIDDYYDKYLIKGNGKRREVSFIVIGNSKKISSYIGLFKKNNIPVSFFIDGTFLDNKEFINTIKPYGIELLSYNGEYLESFFKSSLSYLEAITGNKPSFCFTEENNYNLLNMCSNLKMHTIKGKIYSKDLFRSVRSNLENSIIIPIGDVDIDELSTLIIYLKKKGYSFVSINQLFREEDA